MKAVCHAVSLQDGDTEKGKAGARAALEGRARLMVFGLGSVRKEKCLLVTSPFNTRVRTVIFGFEGLSSKLTVGKISLVAWMLLASS